MEEKSTLGSRIRSWRLLNGMTQAQLALKLNVTDKAVSKWERDVSCPDMSLFPALADLMGVTIDDLLQECIGDGQPSRLLQIFGMSHDIRTPLHIIIGCTDMAGNHPDDREQVDHCLQSIRISAEYLLKTFDKMLRVTAQEQGGSARLPAAADADDLREYFNNRQEKATAPEGLPPEFDFSGKRILVVDDIWLNQEIVSELLSKSGACAEYAENGKICVEKVEQAPAGYYDLILMDILMPVMDGAEAARRIRALEDPSKASVPIIAVSANVYEKDRKAAADAGMNAFIEKPVVPQQLYETMQELLQ